jgi:hypothetical protein
MGRSALARRVLYPSGMKTLRTALTLIALTSSACAVQRASVLEAPRVVVGDEARCVRGNAAGACLDHAEARELLQDYVASSGVVVGASQGADLVVDLPASARSLALRVMGTARYAVEYRGAANEVLRTERGVLFGSPDRASEQTIALAPDLRADAILVRFSTDLGDEAQLYALTYDRAAASPAVAGR